MASVTSSELPVVKCHGNSLRNKKKKHEELSDVRNEERPSVIKEIKSEPQETFSLKSGGQSVLTQAAGTEEIATPCFVSVVKAENELEDSESDTGYHEEGEEENELQVQDLCLVNISEGSVGEINLPEQKNMKRKRRRNPDGVELYSCSLCSQTFKHKSRLSSHYIVHQTERPFQCSICNKRYKTEYLLKVHRRTHLGERPYTCNVCNKSFIYRSGLITHSREHTGELPFECSFCPKRFKDKSHLITHLSAHSTEKPFSCSVCSKSFKMKSHLLEHTQIHTGEKPFKCSQCNKMFNRKSYLVAHIRKHATELPYVCSLCDSAFKDEDGLAEHAFSVHK